MCVPCMKTHAAVLARAAAGAALRTWLHAVTHAAAMPRAAACAAARPAASRLPCFRRHVSSVVSKNDVIPTFSLRCSRMGTLLLYKVLHCSRKSSLKECNIETNKPTNQQTNNKRFDTRLFLIYIYYIIYIY